MSTDKHRPDFAKDPPEALDSEGLLFEYACGTLDEALSLLMASYVSLSGPARAQLSYYETVGGALMNTVCTPVAMNKTSLRTVLDHIDRKADHKARPAATASDYAVPPHHLRKRKTRPLTEMTLPKALIDHIAYHESAIRYRRLPRTKLYEIPVPGTDFRLMLMQCGPGVQIAAHHHSGPEITLVLEGAFSDENGTYQSSELVIYEDHHGSHSPQACPQQGCVCVMAMKALPSYDTFASKLLALFFR